MRAHSSVCPVRNAATLLSCTVTLSGEVNIAQLLSSQFHGAFRNSKVRAKKEDYLRINITVKNQLKIFLQLQNTHRSPA